MLKITRYGPVLRFDLSRSFAGRGRYWTAAYLVDGMLVDSGCAHTASEVERVTQKENLTRIVNTHSHEDHIGANGILQRRVHGLEILAHPAALPVLADPRRTQPLQPYRRMFWGWPEPSVGSPLLDQEIIQTERYRFRVIYTPGHSPDHICLYEQDQGWLFTGDLYVGGRDRGLRPDFDIWQIIASLKKIAGLPATMLFPGSARVRSHPDEALKSKIAYLEDLGQRVLELHHRGWEAGAIARALCGGPMFIELLTLGHFSRRNLALSFIRNYEGK